MMMIMTVQAPLMLLTFAIAMSSPAITVVSEQRPGTVATVSDMSIVCQSLYLSRRAYVLLSSIFGTVRASHLCGEWRGLGPALRIAIAVAKGIVH